MKFFQFLTICSLTFLPTPVEGYSAIWFFSGLIYNILQGIFYPKKRDERDCNALKRSTGQDITGEECSCYGDRYNGVFLNCIGVEVCLSPSDPTFCTASTSNSYVATSTHRKAWSSSTSPLIMLETVSTFFRAPDFESFFAFTFVHGDGSSSSKKYSNCSATSASSFFLKEEFNYVDCASCNICENGVDFKYDCSNANGTLTNTGTLTPGPIIESCFPVADFLPII